MKELVFLTSMGENISFINKEIMNYSMTIRDYKEVYEGLLNNINELLNFYNELFRELDTSKELSEELKNKFINCEIEAWQIYCSFMRNNINTSLKHMILLIKNFKKDSDYKLAITEISSIRKKIQNKSNTMKPIEILEQYRLLGKRYKNLENERIIKNWFLFWTAIGAIGLIISLVITATK